MKDITKHKLIHPDRVEDLDEKNKNLEASSKDPQKTGYSSTCIIYNKPHRREIVFRKSFVEEKIPAGVILIYKVLKQEKIMLEPVDLSFINRTSVAHIEPRRFFSFRRYPYRALLDTTPEPSMIMLHSKVSPKLPAYKYRLDEYIIRSDEGKDVKAYQFVPLRPVL